MDMLDFLQEKAEIVDEKIDELIPENAEPQELTEASRHLITAGGKRLRPVLTLTASEAVGENTKNAIETAAAVEILHTFTLVHDDIMDQDELRRGVETVHEGWDESMAIIAGDALFAKVFEALGENAKKANLSAEKIIQLFDTVSKTSFKICQGQALDVGFEKRYKVTDSEYLEMVEKKTGALIKASTKSGALLGGGNEKEVNALAEYGKLTGIAFQIHDDLLGVAGEQEKVGKPIGSDIREGKWTLPTVHAYQEATQEERGILLDILGTEDAPDKEIEKVVDIFKKNGAIEFAKSKAQEWVENAKSELEIIPDSESKDFLLELADFSIEREL